MSLFCLLFALSVWKMDKSVGKVFDIPAWFLVTYNTSVMPHLQFGTLILDGMKCLHNLTFWLSVTCCTIYCNIQLIYALYQCRDQFQNMENGLTS